MPPVDQNSPYPKDYGKPDGNVYAVDVKRGVALAVGTAERFNPPFTKNPRAANTTYYAIPFSVDEIKCMADTIIELHERLEETKVREQAAMRIATGWQTMHESFCYHKPHVWQRRRDGRQCRDCGKVEFGIFEDAT